MKKKLNVVAALIKENNKILLCQRKAHDKYGSLWEFPGGTVEDNESLPSAIQREIEEELGVKIKAKNLISEFFDEDDTLIIKVFLFSCSVESGIFSTKDCQDFGFFSIEDAEKLNLAPADKKIFSYLKKSN